MKGAFLIAILCGSVACHDRTVAPGDGPGAVHDGNQPGPDLRWPTPDMRAPPDVARIPISDGLHQCTAWAEKAAFTFPYTIDVTVGTTGLKDGVQIGLSLAGIISSPVAKIANSKAFFPGVMIPSGLASVSATPVAPGCTTTTKTFAVPPPTCKFTKPTDGSTIPAPYNKLLVIVDTVGAAGGKVSLFADGLFLGTGAPGKSGRVYFSVPLASGRIKLMAEVSSGSSKGTCMAKVVVGS